MSLRSINPATGELLREHPMMSRLEWTGVITRAHAAHLGWRERSTAERAGYFNRLADHFEARKPLYARLMADEMGKPITQGGAEIDKCAWACRHFAQNGAAL